MMEPLLMLASAAIPVTIADVHARPEFYHGKRVQLEGWVNDCQLRSCHLSERLGRGTDDYRERLSIGADDLLDENLKPITPARILLEATVNASCLTTEICLDRADVLSNVVLRNILVRN